MANFVRRAAHCGALAAVEGLHSRRGCRHPAHPVAPSWRHTVQIFIGIMVETQEQLESVIAEWGFLPFFKNAIEGFSVEEIVAPDLLFGEHGEEGAWQWKGPIISHWQSAYGKFFGGKAGFVSLEWLPDFVNWRRALYPRRKMGADARRILSVLVEQESMLSKQLKVASGFTLSRKRRCFNPDDPSEPIVNKRNGTAFDSLIAGLQMGTYVCIADFEYQVSRKGEPYGWGVARYCTPEAMYDIDWKGAVEGRTPRQSFGRMEAHISRLFPCADMKKIERMVGI